MADEAAKRDALREAALHYHRADPPGKLGVHATKPMQNQRDLALAYSPGVAFACEAICEDPTEADRVTARGNLVAVISNGTAVLGLGAIGPLASKPVMEGKAVLFRKFAGIDVFDIEVAEKDPDKFCDIVAALEPTFGGVNLEDIKAPECFEIEAKLRARMGVPVFHDDQHGTAIVVAAAILNGLRVVGKEMGAVKLAVSGAGAAAIACLDLLVTLGVKRENIFVSDLYGVLYEGRVEELDERRARYAQKTDARTLQDVIAGADIFLGLSAPGVLTVEDVKRMAKNPLILALANPTPEIMPELAQAARPDAVICTGRTDYPNQVNNVLCFPFLFRGALDCGATTINEEMKAACVRAIADLAMQEPSEAVARAYGGEELRFGPTYLIPKPFDPRLIVEIPPAIARAAMETGVARRPIADFDAYVEKLKRQVVKTGFLMKPIFELARSAPRRVVYAEGEEERALRAAQIVLDDGIAQLTLIGRRAVIEQRLERYGLRLKIDRDFQVVDPEDDPRYDSYWRRYHEIMKRRGVTPAIARERIRTRNTVIASLMVDQGEADAMICGLVGRYRSHLEHVEGILGLCPGVSSPYAMSGLVLPNGSYFFVDTQIVTEPTADEIAEMTLLAAAEVARFGLEPKVALLSHSNFGSSPAPSAQAMRQAFAILRERAPDLAVEGEMQADAAIDGQVRAKAFPESCFEGAANLLVAPNRDAANIAFNLLKSVGEGISIGPILLGGRRPAHILTPSATGRALVNVTALAGVQALT